ncbi:MAG TPA: response regulator [Burkholderiales bacterium]|nr:response regulator [Burkholderiales bacterium]
MQNPLAATQAEILVVDDDRDTAMMFAQLLEQLGHTVRYVTDPHAVVELARRTRPWLIFLDIGMPAITGWQLAPLLKSELGREGVRLVAVSGYGAPEHHRRSREAGFDAHVQKPVDFLLLQSILKQLR